MDKLPEYRREIPDEWPALLAQTEDIIRDNHGINRDSALTTFKEVGKLDAERLEVVRFYGLGVHACHFVRHLVLSDVRYNFVQQVAERVYQFGRDNHSPRPGVRVGDLNWGDKQDPMTWVTAGFISSAQQTVDPTTRLLADSLQARHDHKAHLYKATAGVKTRRAEETRNAKALLNSLDGSIPYAARWTAANLLAGARESLIKMFDTMNADRILGPFDMHDGNPLISDLVSEEELRALPLLPISRPVACLRLDEFTSDLSHLVLSNAQRQPEFAHNNVPVSPRTLKDPAIVSGDLVVFHKDRLTCPALQIVGAIQIVTELFPDIIVQAQQRAAIDHARQSVTTCLVS